MQAVEVVADRMPTQVMAKAVQAAAAMVHKRCLVERAGTLVQVALVLGLQTLVVEVVDV
jgi:hypothetical protein